MELCKVNDAKTEKEFISLPFEIYKNDSNWIAPLEDEIKAIFSEKNPEMKDGKAARWLLKDDNGKTAGRIAAFYKNSQLKEELPTGGIGFFECTDNQLFANRLFFAAGEWLENNGFKAMDGPVNFGERDKFWGLLVKGFAPPSFLENYNPPYYQKLFEDFGFKKYFEQQTYKLDRDTFNRERLSKIATHIEKKRNVRGDHLRLSNIDKYADDFLYIYNNAWKHFENFKPLQKDQLLTTFQELKPIIVEDLIIFVYVDDEPAGLFVILPDANQIFKYLDGKLNIWNKLKFLWYKKRNPITKLKGLVFGIHPKFHNSGVDALLVHYFMKGLDKYPQYKYGELSWIGEFNPKMQGFMKNLQAEISKVHYTYRYIFDKTISFKPFQIKEN